MRVASGGGVAARSAATISAIAKDSSRRPSWLAADTSIDVEPARLEVGADEPGDLAGVGHVDLVEGDDARPVVQSAVRGQLSLDDVEVGDRVAAGLRPWRSR